MTNDDAIRQRELEERAAIKRQRIRNASIMREQRHCQSAAPALENKKNYVKLAIEIMKATNGQDDIRVKDFIKNIKKTKDRYNQPSLELDSILSEKKNTKCSGKSTKIHTN